jgi:hypothetical protein
MMQEERGGEERGERNAKKEGRWWKATRNATTVRKHFR